MKLLSLSLLGLSFVSAQAADTEEVIRVVPEDPALLDISDAANDNEASDGAEYGDEYDAERGKYNKNKGYNGSSGDKDKNNYNGDKDKDKYQPPTQKPYKPVTQKPYKPVTQKPYKPVTQKPYKPVTQKPYKPVTYKPTTTPRPIREYECGDHKIRDQMNNDSELNFLCEDNSNKSNRSTTCRVKCGGNGKGRNGDTPRKIYCIKMKYSDGYGIDAETWTWASKKGKAFDVDGFGCKGGSKYGAAGKNKDKYGGKDKNTYKGDKDKDKYKGDKDKDKYNGDKDKYNGDKDKYQPTAKPTQKPYKPVTQKPYKPVTQKPKY